MKQPLVSILRWPQWHTGIITVHAVPHCSLRPMIKTEPDCWLCLEEKNSWGNSSTASHRSKLAHICASFLWLSASMWRIWMGTDGKALGHLWDIHARITGPFIHNSVLKIVDMWKSGNVKCKVNFWFLVLVHCVYIQETFSSSVVRWSFSFNNSL